jgi:IclR family pca regulon transcriptional regulator
VTSLERGLTVLAAFDADRPNLSLSDVARATGLDRSAVRRFLYTLVERGYVRTDGNLFTLHPPVLKLGNAYLAGLALPEIALPYLAELAEKVQEPVSVAVLDADEIVYIARMPGKRLMAISLTVGSRLPAYATSMGRVLLAGKSDDWIDGFVASASFGILTKNTISDGTLLRAELMRIREQGWAMVDEELEVGLRSIAVPIHDAGGVVIAAMNVSSHVSRVDVAGLVDTALPALRDARQKVERVLHAERPLTR